MTFGLAFLMYHGNHVKSLEQHTRPLTALSPHFCRYLSVTPHFLTQEQLRMQNHRGPAAHLLPVVLPSDLHPFPPRVNPPAPLSLSAQAACFPSVAIPFTVPSFALCETRVRYSLLGSSVRLVLIL